MQRSLWFLVLPVILLSLAGCQSEPDRQSAPGSPPPSAGGSSGLTKEFLMNQKFVLVQINGADYTGSADQEMPAPTLEFDNDFLVSGRFCNTFRGGGKLVDDVLKVETLASTRMLCADQTLNQLETRFFQMLGSGATLSMSGDRLFFKQGDSVMVFKADAGLN